MRLITLFSLALLCAGFATALPPLKCDQWKCSPFMGKEVRPGTRLVYSYFTSASAFLPGKKTPVTLNIKTTATFDFYSCRRTLKLSGTRISSQDGALRGSSKSFQSLAAALEKNMLYFRSNDGAVDGLCSKDVPWVSNFKRGLLSVFQQPRSPLRTRRRVHIQMMDIHGSCPAALVRWPTPTTVLTRQLDACRGRHRSFGGLQSEAYSAPSPVQNPGLGSTQRCQFNFDSPRRLVLKSATCNERLMFKAPLIDPLLPQGSARVKQELVLQKKETFKCPTGCRSSSSLVGFRSSGLQMEFEAPQRPAETLKAMTEALCSLAGPVRPETPELFARLAVFLRGAKQADWEKVVKGKPKALCPKRSAGSVTAVLLEGLAEAGDARAVKLLTVRPGMADADKDRLLASLAFARRPGPLLPHLRPVMERFHRLPSASLAAAALVHRFCSEQGGLCDQHRAVRPLLAPLERALKPGCDRIPVAKGVLLFRVLGNMRVPQRIHKSLTDCAERSKKAPVELRVAALQALRRSGCPSPRAALLRILSSTKFDSELRVAAYHALLVCRDHRLAVSLKRTLLFLERGHVSSYIASHAANLRGNSDPDQASLRHFLHDVGYSPSGRGGLSRHFQQSFYSVGSNLGLRANGALVWSEKSASPREVTAGLTGQLFGRAVPLMEMRSRLENVHELMTRSRMPYAQRKFIKEPKATAQLGLRFLGHDLFNRRIEVQRSDLRPFTAALFLKNVLPKNFRWNSIFVDFSTSFASGAGLPLRLAFFGASSAGLETTMWSRSGPKDYMAEGGIKPELALRSELSAAFELPGLSFGGRAAGTAHTRTEWRAKVEAKQRGFTLSIRAPEKQEMVNLKWAIVSLHMNKATPVAPLASSPAIRWRSKPRLGYRLAVEAQSRPGTAASRLNNRISVLAERLDSHTNYVLKLWDMRPKGKREIGVRVDMEGSRTDRALEGDFKWERRGARLSLRGEGREFEGAAGCTKTGDRKESCFLTGRNEKGNLLHLAWDMAFRRPTSEHKIVAKVGKVSLGRLDVRVTTERRLTTFSAQLRDLLRKPVTLSGSIKTTKPNKFSVGEMQQVALNLTSSMLTGELTSKVESSARKFKALFQVGYALPGRPKASASLKFGWTRRLTDTDLSDKYTFKSFASNKPELNADLTLTTVTASDFRAQIVFKSWPRWVPMSASVRVLLDRKDRTTQSLIFQSDYDLPKLSSGEVALMCEWNRQHVSFVTKLKLACMGRQAVNWAMSVKRKTDNQIDASLSFASELTPFGVQSELRRPSNGGLSFRFALQPDFKVELVAKPFYQTVLLEASNAGWMSKGKVLMDFPVGLNCTFSENSRFQIDFRSSHFFRGSDVRVAHRLTSRSEQIYDFSLSHAVNGRKCSGSLDLGVGAGGAQNRLKASFAQDASKNLFNSNVELLMGSASASLRNDYSYELSPEQQKLDGRSHVTSTFGGRKRKLMLQTNMNNLPDQFNSDLQFSSFLDDKPSFVNLKVNVKDKNLRSLAWTVAMDSSFAKAKSAEFDYSHEFAMASLGVKATARYLKKSMQLSFGGNVKGRKEMTGSVGLDLGANKFKGEMSLAARRFAARVGHTNEGVEVRAADLKFSATQPSFDLEVRKDGVKPQKVFLAREGGMWRARLEIDRRGLAGKARLHVGTGYLGHRFYLSHAVEGDLGVPLANLDVKLKPNGELLVAGDCSGAVPDGTACKVNVDYQKQIVVASMEVGPAALSLQTVPRDERFSFALKQMPVRISAGREGDKVKLRTDIFGYGMRFRCQETDWAKQVTVTRAGEPVFRADMTQRAKRRQGEFPIGTGRALAAAFLCVPPPTFRVLRAKFNTSSSTPLAEFAAEATWDEAGAGKVQVRLSEPQNPDAWRPDSRVVAAASRARTPALRLAFDLRSRFRPGALNLTFDVAIEKPRREMCLGRNPRRCFSTFGYKWNTTGEVSFTEGGRYYDVNYKVDYARGSQFRSRSEERYRRARGLYMREVKQRREFATTTIDHKQKVRVDYSEDGQVTAVLYRMAQGLKMGQRGRRIEMYAHSLTLNASGGHFELRGMQPKKYLASEPGSNRVVSLRLRFAPSSSFRLRTGLARRLFGSVVRFDLSGSGRPNNGSLTLKTSMAGRPFLEERLQFMYTRRQQSVELRHVRRPRGGAKVILVAKLDRKRSRAEQSFALTRGSRQVLSTRYVRAERNVSLDLTMFGKKHFQGGWKELRAGYEVLAQSVTMKKPLSLRYLSPSPARTALELRTGADRRPLVLEKLRSDFVFRRGADNIASLKLRPFGRPKTAELRFGKDFFASALLKTGYITSFALKVRSRANLDLSFNQTRRFTNLQASSGQLQLLSASVRPGPAFSLVLGTTVRLTLNGTRLEAIWGGQQVARLTFTRPAPRSVAATLFWRPQLVRLAVNEAAEAWDSLLSSMCVAVRRNRRKMIEQLTADLPEMPPFADARSSFQEFGRVLRMPRAFKSVDFLIQFGFKQLERYLRVSARSIALSGCISSAKDAVLRLRPGIYGLGDRFTTLQTWPDRQAKSFGRFINDIAEFLLERAMFKLQRIKIARPDLSPLLPSFATLRDAQARLNAGLEEIKAVTMLKGMQHLDQKLLRALQKVVGEMLRAAQRMDLPSSLESAARDAERRLEAIGPETWRLQTVRLLRAALRNILQSQLATNMLRDAGHQLNEAARGVFQVAVPRVEQFNWRHGHARLLLHLPQRPLRLRRPALPLPPIDLRRARPGFFRPKVATLYSNFVHTFDQRNYFLDWPCPHSPRMLLSRYRAANFGWDVHGQRRGRSFELQVRLGKKVFTISRSGVKQTGNDRTAQVRLWSKGGVQFMRAYNHGFELETNPWRNYVRMRLLSPHYFGKLEGVWGNNDELPSNDWAVPGAPYNSSRRRFSNLVLTC